MTTTRTRAAFCALAFLTASSGAWAQEQAVRRSLDLAPDASQSRALAVVEEAVAAAALAPIGQEVSISTRIAFDFDSARLTPEAQAQLAHIAAAMLGPATQGARFLIEGHTDSRGAEAYNAALSRRRAEAVAGRLAAYGVHPQRLGVVGFGEARPLPGIDPAAGVQRRVEFLILR